MKLLDIFKKKKPKEKKPEEKKVEARPLPRIAYPVRDYKGKEKTQRKQISNGAYQVLESPHITEKVTELEKENKYVFKVFQKTNKIEIKKAIEGLYGVDVVDVKIINVPRRRKRLGRQEGWKKGYKKAIVKVKKGQKIEIIPR